MCNFPCHLKYFLNNLSHFIGKSHKKTLLEKILHVPQESANIPASRNPHKPLPLLPFSGFVCLTSVSHVWIIISQNTDLFLFHWLSPINYLMAYYWLKIYFYKNTFYLVSRLILVQWIYSMTFEFLTHITTQLSYGVGSSQFVNQSLNTYHKELYLCYQT
jgi:hypothetical protein